MKEREEEDGCVGNSGWTASMSAAAFRKKGRRGRDADC